MSSAKHSVSWDLHTRQLLLPKLDHEASECEDVIAFDQQNGRFAVADGATEAFDARKWAERLAQHWVQHESALTAEQFRAWVAGEGREMWYSERAKPSGSELSSIGYSIFDERRVEMWQLNKSTAPSSVPSDMICWPISFGSPSLDSPSVRCRTVGGNPRG